MKARGKREARRPWLLYFRAVGALLRQTVNDWCWWLLMVLRRLSELHNSSEL